MQDCWAGHQTHVSHLPSQGFPLLLSFKEGGEEQHQGEHALGHQELPGLGESIYSGPGWDPGKQVPLGWADHQNGGRGTVFISRSGLVSSRCQDFTLSVGRLPSIAGSVLPQFLVRASFVAFITTLFSHLCWQARLFSPVTCSYNHPDFTCSIDDCKQEVGKQEWLPFKPCNWACPFNPLGQASSSERKETILSLTRAPAAL